MTELIRKYRRALIAIVVLVVIALPLTILQLGKQQERRSGAAGPTVTVTLSPASQSYPVNASIPVTININSGASGITAFDTTVTYDAAVLQLSNFTPSSSYNLQLVNGPPNNTIGSIRIAFGSNSQTAPSGNVVLGTLNFTAKAAGVGKVSFGNLQIADPSSVALTPSFTTPAGTYTITAATSACATNNNAGGCGGGQICCKDGTCAVPGACADKTCPQGFSALCNTCCATGTTCTSGQNGYQCIKTGDCVMGSTCFAPSSCINNVCVAPTTPPPPPQPTATTAPSPTTTPAPTGPTPTGGQNGNAKSLSFKLSLPGIGASASGNLNLNNSPRRPNRDINIKVINAQGVETAFNGNIPFNRSTGKFEGTAGIGSALANGPYTIKVRMDNTLWKAVPGIIQLTNGTITLPEITLVTGDVSQDNQMNVDDYNALTSCFGKTSCTNRVKTDLNDDDIIDDLDLSIMIAAFLKRNGD